MRKKYGLIAALLVLVLALMGCNDSSNHAGNGGSVQNSYEALTVRLVYRAEVVYLVRRKKQGGSRRHSES